jgi:uncharacterized membrane protein YeaQ/YmgE (transglycosylase-associated protein family)
MVDIIVTVIIGGVVGWLGSLVMKTDAQMGILGNIVVGIVGSFLGFWVAGLIGLGASGPILRWGWCRDADLDFEAAERFQVTCRTLRTTVEMGVDTRRPATPGAFPPIQRTTARVVVPTDERI